jgi:AraC-like DNA-binding protein
VAFTVSTTAVDDRSQGEFWREAIGNTFVPLELELPAARAARFAGRLTAETLESVEVATVDSDPHSVFRSPKTIRQSASDVLFVMVPRAGLVRIHQDGREALLRPGDLATYDSARPCRIGSPGRFRMVVLKLPRTAFTTRCLPEPAPATTATAIPGDHGIGAVVSPFVRALPDNVSALTPELASRLETNAVELVSSALSVLTGSRDRLPHEAQRQRARRYILDHLGDPGLGPATVAAALGMSVRYLHLLFQQENTSPARWILAQRLTRAARLLRGPDHAQWSITEIAYRLGFTDASVFSRAFKAGHGMSPRDYRKGLVS